MPHPTVVSATLNDILTACRTRLIAVTGFPVERVRFLDPDRTRTPPPQADQVVHFWPEIGTPAPNYYGSGRLDTRRAVRLVAQVATRFGVDEEDSSEAWLLDQTLGHLVAVATIEDALIGFLPEDANGNALATHPIEPAPVTKPQPDRADPDWGYSRVGFLVTRIVPLTQSYQ